MDEILIEDEKYWLNGEPKNKEDLKELFANGTYRAREYKFNGVIETYSDCGYISRKDGPALSIYENDGVTVTYSAYMYKNVPYDNTLEDLEKEFLIIDLIDIVEK